jgi:transcriptional regulator with XRE-family HTH domain
VDFLGGIMTFYDKIEKLTKDNGLTAKQVTQDLHISKNSFTYWKKNGNIPKGDILEALAKYFNCSIDYLVGKTDIKKEPTAQNEQSVSEELQKLIDASSSLSDDETQKVLEYVEFLKSQRK